MPFPTSRAIALALTLLTATACGSGQTGSALQPLDAAALLTLASTRTPTTLPDAPALTLATLTDKIAATQPAAKPVGALSATQVAQALRTTAELVAATRVDPAHMCGPADGNPMAKYGTAHTRDWLNDPDNAEGRSAIQYTITDARDLKLANGPCGGLRLVGDGVLIGPHTWTARADADDDTSVWIDYIGRYTHLLADNNDHPVPYSAEYRESYQLIVEDGSWKVDAWDYGYYSTGALRSDIKLPAGYLPKPADVTADRDALKAVQQAVTTWNAKQGATMVDRSTVRTGGSSNLSDDDVNAVITESTLSPAGHYGTDESYQPGDTARTDSRTLSDDEYYSRMTKGVTYEKVPFTDGRVNALYTGGIDTADDPEILISSAVGGTGFVTLLERAVAAAEQPCPAQLTDTSDLPAPAAKAAKPSTCLIALIPTAGPQDDDASSARQAAAGRGHAFLAAHVGLTATGELAQVRLDQDAAQHGEPPNPMSSHAWFLSTSDTAPPRPQAPNKSLVTAPTTVY